MTKYQCQNCQNCCITTSSEVSYCGTLIECNPPHISYSQAVVFTVLTIFLFGAILTFFYFAFKDRKLGSPEQKEEEQFKDQIEIKPAGVVGQKVVDKKQNIRSYRATGQLSINSKISKKSKSKTRSAKSPKKIEAQTQTQRGLR